MVILTAWVIYWPLPYYPFYMLRRSFSLSDPTVVIPGTFPSLDNPCVVHEERFRLACTLEDIRSVLPPGLVCMGDPSPFIVEVWT